MKFVFHPAYDSELPSKVRTLAEGSSPVAELGVVYGGETALLRILELHLGIVSQPSSRLDRTLSFLNLLEDRCTTQNPFYADSLKVDPIGTARTLLGWRDQLVLANWLGVEGESSTGRLQEMSALNHLASQIPIGEADRFLFVWKCLQTRSLDFLKVETLVPLESIRGLLGRIMRKLGAGTIGSVKLKPSVKNDTDLQKLQTYLTSSATSPKGDRNPDFKGDGTVTIIEAISDTLLARYCVSGMLKWNNNKNESYAVLAGLAQDIFNIAASANGLPRIMPGDGDGLRSSSAFLHLLMEMAWNPHNVNLWLQFLNLSPNPISDKLRSRLSSALGESPGVGSEEWFGAIDGFIADQTAEGKPSVESEVIDVELRDWLCKSVWIRRQGATRDQCNELLQRVVGWCERELSTEENRFFSSLKGDAVQFIQSLEYWFLKREKISEKTLGTLFQESLGRGKNPGLDPQASAIHCGEHPAALRGEIDRLLIWNLGDKQKVRTLPWTVAEQKYLVSQGCDFTNAFDEIDEKTSSLISLIFSTKESLTIAFATQVLAKESGLHPLLREITEIPNSSPLFVKVGPRLEASPHISLEQRLHPIPLPSAQRHWQIAPELFSPRYQESASSIEKIINSPQSYVLNNVAKLRAPSWQFTLGLDNIKGKLIHKLFELFVDALKKGEAFHKPDSYRAWISLHFDKLVSERAKMLQVESQALHLAQLKMEIENGIRKFHAEIADVPASDVHSEFALDTTKGRWMDKQIWAEVTGDALKVSGIRPHLRGSVDLCWKDKQGNTKILDIKWSSRATKNRDVLADNKQIQIAIYSALLKDGVWPAAGYLTLPHATIRTLAHDQKAFLDPQFTPQSVDADHPSSQLWSDVQALWVWRWGQLRQGFVEITTEKLGKGEQKHPVFDPPPGVTFQLEDEVTDYDYSKILTGTGRKAG